MSRNKQFSQNSLWWFPPVLLCQSNLCQSFLYSRDLTLEEPIIIPPIRFQEGTIWYLRWTKFEAGGSSSAEGQGKELVIKTEIESPEHDDSFVNSARLDGALLHLSKLNHTVSQLKQDHRASSMNIEHIKEKLFNSLKTLSVDVSHLILILINSKKVLLMPC